MSTPWVLVIMSLAVVVSILAFLQLGLMRRVLDLLEGLTTEQAAGVMPHDRGLRPGDAVPEARAFKPDGQSVDVSALSHRGPEIVLLASAECEPCHQLLGGLSESGWQADARLIIVVDEPTAHDSDLSRHGMLILTDSPSTGVERALQSSVYPRAFALHRGRVVAPAVIPGSVDDLVALARRLDVSGKRKEFELN